MEKLIGRKEEKTILKSTLQSNLPELIVIYGRRRIGKTFLVRNVFKNHFCFEFSGTYKIPLKDQLKQFSLTLSKETTVNKQPNSWIEAFHLLSLYLDKLKSKMKKVIFIDEFPWLDTRKSKFLPAFEHFWNDYVTKREDLIVVVCGSAASYMIKKIIDNKGGLHNRITQSIQLLPFNLNETEQLLRFNNVNLTRYNILQLYMTMGGVPLYLQKILPGESVAQAIDRLCFKKDGFLKTEFRNIFESLFDQHTNHEAIIKTLSKVRKGLTREEILNKSRINSGGTLTKTLRELECSGFIENYLPYHGVKDSTFRLTDEYSMFYYKYIVKSNPSQGNTWLSMERQPSYTIWSGFSFEGICIKHIKQIKESLKIGGIITTHGSWIEKNAKKNAQIDLLIDRSDNVINLCEMKFYNSVFTIDKRYAGELANKVNAFVSKTKTKKSVFITFITTYGLTHNKYRTQHVQKELTINDLFIDL